MRLKFSLTQMGLIQALYRYERAKLRTKFNCHSSRLVTKSSPTYALFFYISFHLLHFTLFYFLSIFYLTHQSKKISCELHRLWNDVITVKTKVTIYIVEVIYNVVLFFFFFLSTCDSNSVYNQTYFYGALLSLFTLFLRPT